MCEACLFCIYPLSAAVCTVLFPEHRNTADALTARPPSNPSARARGAPHVHIRKDTLSLLRYVLRACTCLAFGAKSETGGDLDGFRLICYADRL